MIADVAREAAEKDKLREALQQAAAYAQQAQQQAAMWEEKYMYATRLLVATISELGRDGRASVKHRTLGEVPAVCHVFKRTLDDMYLELEVITTEERLAEIRAEASGNSTESAPEAGGDSPAVDGKEGAEGSGRLVDQRGSPLVTD